MSMPTQDKVQVLFFAANAESEFKTLPDFLKAARAQPGKLNVGTINVGGTQNLAAELLKSQAGVNFQIIPYRTTPDVIAALTNLGQASGYYDANGHYIRVQPTFFAFGTNSQNQLTTRPPSRACR